MNMRVLVVAAHPDDEVLGCGATCARHSDAGDEVHVLILCEGITSRDDARDPAVRQPQIRELQACAEAAARTLGTRPPVFQSFPDNRLDTVPLIDVVKAVEAMVQRSQPAIVYTHHGSDLNVDHRVAHQAVMTACRPVPGGLATALYAFETVSSTEWSSSAIGEQFRPSRFVDIRKWMTRKLDALRAYGSEMRPFPHARSLESVEALARWRGASAGMEAAEAFVTLRELVHGQR